ncbi:MAG: acyloxyacyl hydrolase [Bacteroidales bacterium]|nr:acyloxyacyl hydrolase [Bacteroidales bacterium]
MKRSLSIALLLILGTALPLHGQNEGGSHWEVGHGVSYMMTNNSSYSHYNAVTYGIDLAWWYRSFGADYWRVHRHYPSFGLKASYVFIPRGVAGDRIGLVGLLRRPLGRQWDLDIGLGLSAYTRPFSLTGDSLNIFIGSLINCLIDLSISYRATEHSMLHLSLLHTSNGMLYRPNQGLNYLQVGMAYWLGPIRTAKPARLDEEPHWSPSEFGVALSLGTVMSRREEQRGYYPCYDLSLHFMHYLSPTFAVGGTLDFWYNDVDSRQIARTGDIHAFPLYVSALAGFEAFFGPLSIKAGIGPNLIASNEVSIPFYERVGAYYNFGDGRHYAGVALNAHAGRIEFIEWTYGYRLRE